MKNGKLIGYRVPKDLKTGTGKTIKKGNIIINTNINTWISNNDYLITIPEELVEYWEPVYEKTCCAKAGEWVKFEGGRIFDLQYGKTYQLIADIDSSITISEGRYDINGLKLKFSKCTEEEIRLAPHWYPEGTKCIVKNNYSDNWIDMISDGKGKFRYDGDDTSFTYLISADISNLKINETK